MWHRHPKSCGCAVSMAAYSSNVAGAHFRDRPATACASTDVLPPDRCYACCMDHEQVLAVALELPAEQRAALAGRLIQSLDPTVDNDVESAWSEEIRRRLERLDSGQAVTIPWAEARRRIRSAAGHDVHG